ncbi:nucleoporin NUP188-like, partial [Saccoglossus kowalevskii]
CLSVVKNNHTSACMLEAERTTVFLFQLAHFPREWRFEMPDGLSATHSIVCHLIQNCMALLLRPRLLQHRLLHSAGSHVPQSLLRPIGSVRTLQHQTSTDDIDTPSQQLMVVQA